MKWIFLVVICLLTVGVGLADTPEPSGPFDFTTQADLWASFGYDDADNTWDFSTWSIPISEAVLPSWVGVSSTNLAAKVAVTDLDGNAWDQVLEAYGTIPTWGLKAGKFYTSIPGMQYHLNGIGFQISPTIGKVTPTVGYVTNEDGDIQPQGWYASFDVCNYATIGYFKGDNYGLLPGIDQDVYIAQVTVPTHWATLRGEYTYYNADEATWSLAAWNSKGYIRYDNVNGSDEFAFGPLFALNNNARVVTQIRYVDGKYDGLAVALNAKY